MRQDAVMQQFFRLVNDLLGGCAATARRRLQMVTYKVCEYSLDTDAPSLNGTLNGV